MVFEITGEDLVANKVDKRRDSNHEFMAKVLRPCSSILQEGTKETLISQEQDSEQQFHWC